MEEAENIELRSRPWNPKPCGKFMSCFLGVGAGLGFGVVFPTMLVFLVLITSLNENGCGWLPLPTPVHVALLVSVPLAVAKDGKSARFPAPSMVARNFNYDAGMLGLPKSETVQFEKPLPSQVAYFGKDDFAVVQISVSSLLR